MMVIPKALSIPNIIIDSGFNPTFQTMAVGVEFQIFFYINFSKSNVEFAFWFWFCDDLWLSKIAFVL